MRSDRLLYIILGFVIGFLSFWFFEIPDAIFVMLVTFYLVVGMLNAIIFLYFYYKQLLGGEIQLLGLLISFVIAIVSLIFLVTLWPLMYITFNKNKEKKEDSDTFTALENFELKMLEKYGEEVREP